jgi:multicomponent Na+:H+ antiporter subunit F
VLYSGVAWTVILVPAGPLAPCLDWPDGAAALVRATGGGSVSMATVLTVLLIVLVANMLLALVRVLLGPSGRDRLTGVLLAGTTGAAGLATASVLTGVRALRDVALVLVALAVVVVVARLRAEQDSRAGQRQEGR